MKPMYTEVLGGGRLAVLDLFPIEGIQTISRINTPVEYRRMGVGTRLLTEVCRDADAEAEVLTLCIFASGEMDGDALAKWYAKFGFVPYPPANNPHVMWRLPNGASS